MESYDVAGADLERWRSSRLSSDAHNRERLLLKPDQLEPVTALVRTVRSAVVDPDNDISRRKVERFARNMRKHRSDNKVFDSQVEEYLNLEEFKQVAGLCTRQKLYHLAALWDYIT